MSNRNIKLHATLYWKTARGIVSTLFSNETLERLGASHGAYGRPIPPKDELLLRERMVRKELSPGGVEPIAIMRHTSSGARKKTPRSGG